MKACHWLLQAGGIVCVCTLGCTDSAPQVLAKQCHAVGDYEEVAWQRIHDGDTLVLSDGRRVRILGLNAPELADKGASDPLADEATDAARNFLAGTSTLLIQTGVDPTDRYGRTLAHVFRKEDSASLTQYVISKGLAWQIAVPPNLAYHDCYLAAEEQARQASLGVWSPRYKGKDQFERPGPGYRILRTQIQSVRFRGTWWLETEDGFVIKVASADQGWFDRGQVEDWRGAEVEVRGWMYGRQGSAAVARGFAPWVLGLRHPSALRLVGED